jgi:hypothetical protein
MENELCPICIENPGINFTECNHGFCITCLCRIKKCAMCRNPLQRAKICSQIQERFNINETRNEHMRFRSYIEINLPQITPIRRSYISRAIYNNRIMIRGR